MAKAKSDEKSAPSRTPAAKTASAPRSRRDKLASLEDARKKEQRSRTIKLLVICLVLAIALLAYPVYLFVDDYRARNASIEDLGASIGAAGCDPVTEHEATGNQDHVAEGSKVDYSQTPPDSGKHYPSPAPFTKRFYTMADRPPVETLVHNLEHGYTVLWYLPSEEAARSSQLQELASLGNKLAPSQAKFIVAPWNEAYGAFPSGKKYALSHWSATTEASGKVTAQSGHRQLCGDLSGEAVKSFVTQFPRTDAPEPLGA